MIVGIIIGIVAGITVTGFTFLGKLFLAYRKLQRGWEPILGGKNPQQKMKYYDDYLALPLLRRIERAWFLMNK